MPKHLDKNNELIEEGSIIECQNKQTKQKTTYFVKLDTNLNALVCCAQEDSKYYINTLDRIVKDNNIVVIDEHFSLYI